MVLIAMMAAVAYLLVFFIRIPVVLFLNYEPKDVIITIGGFLLGPMSALATSLVVSFVEMVTISTTGPIGALMNFISTCSFVCTAALIYKKRRNLAGAVIGLLVGSVTMIATMLLWNYLITPLYMTGTSRSQIADMLIPVFLPFNALKAGFNTTLTLLLYKPLVTALRRTGLVERKSPAAGSSKLGLYIFSAALLITCILLLLVWRGVI
ncbi:MAG: ECF transporter S component [Oscillospiraceae bacterium]|nr:ECF transporter S component [Oscillospiraceae bacterium]